MPEKDSILINDDLFQKTVSCPLKFYHALASDGMKKSYDFFRQRNKLHVRDAIALQFQQCKHTSSGVQEAAKETEVWLKNDSAAICGAVIQHKNLLTRIPILVKEGGRFTIIQVHGSLRKRSEGNRILPGVHKKSTQQYLLKAAFRLEVLKRSFPNDEIEVHFYFPGKQFKASVDGLNLFNQEQFSRVQELREEFSALFSKVSATEAVRNIHQKMPDLVVHKSFENISLSKAIEKIAVDSENDIPETDIKKHPGCKYCEFRLPDHPKQEGCWTRFFPAEDIKHPEKHVFDLIGHGNTIHSESGIFYQEEAERSRSSQSFEELQQHGGPAITILQRRNLQILKAQDQPVPSVWIKPGIKTVMDLKFPLHFLDFEAATYAIPMEKGARPYSSVYFQFSCHTLYKDGRLVHTEWLDQQPGVFHPHREFVNQLGTIPDIFQGTILQYSPFEKQGVNRLLGNLNKDPDENIPQIQILEKIRGSELPGYEHRFFDVSKLIRDYYYNHFFKDGLGLKQVLSSILEWEQYAHPLDIPPVEIDETRSHPAGTSKEGGTSVPYLNLQQLDLSITDGSAAMHAWLCLKNGLLTEEEKTRIPKILRIYCAVDSYALVVIYKHLERFFDRIQRKDLIEF